MAKGEGFDEAPEQKATVEQLRRGALTGTMWVAGQKFGARFVSFAVFALLGRLLAPEDFGTVAVAAAFASYSGLLVDFGLPVYIVQAETFSRRERDTVAWIALIFAGIAGLLQFTLAGVIAAWMDQPQVQPVLQVLAITLPLAAISGIQIAIYRRRLEFRAVAVRGLVAVFVSGCVAVALALAGAGVWALVAQTISFQLVSMLMLWIKDPWFPRTGVDRQIARNALTFGSKAFATMALDTLAASADSIILGKRLGSRDLGFYSVSYRTARVALDALVGTIYSVANPVFARAKGTAGGPGPVYARVVTQSILISSRFSL